MHEYKKTLRWLEPWNGWDINSAYDTGLCNRIFHWEIGQHINRFNNYEYTILLERKYWPEMLLIDLPNTVVVNSDDMDSPKLHSLKFKTVFDTKNEIVRLASPIDEKMLESLFSKKDFGLNKFENHYYSDFGFKTLNELVQKFQVENLPEVRPINNIHLRHKSIEFFLKNQLKDVVGIHIRRGNGIHMEEKDFETFTKAIRGKLRRFKEQYTVDTCENCYFYDDYLYFNIMDNMLKINPNQKFYISSDLPYDVMQFYRSKYGLSLVDNLHIYNTVKTFLYNAGYYNQEILYGNIVQTVSDLFSLSYSGYMIKVPHSTWSDFADWKENNFSSRIDESWDGQIKKKYKTFLKQIS